MSLSPSEKRRVERYMADLEEVRETLAKITAADLARIVQSIKMRTIADGFKSGGFSVGGGGSSESTPTEQAALRGLPDDEKREDDWRFHSQLDPVRDASVELLAYFLGIVSYAELVKKRHAYLRHTGEALRGRVTTLDQCMACLRDVSGVGDDRIRAGFCSSDYKAWLRAGRPDRMAFITSVQSKQAS